MKTTQHSLRAFLAICSGVLAAATASGATYLWNVAAPGANNWNVNANWTPSTGNPGAADTATFGDVGPALDAFTPNNVVSVGTNILVLNYTNTTVNTWHVTQIPAGQTLSVSNLNVGFTAATGNVSATNSSDTLVTSVAMLDAGTLSVYGNLTIGNGGANRQNGTMLDLSGLTNFMYANSNGTFQVSFGNRSGASLKLASASNHVTATTMNLNTTSTSVNTTGILTLGAGTNLFHVGALNAALGRGSCTIQFPAGSGPEAGLRIRGSAGTEDSRANLTLANRTASGSGGTGTGKLLLDGHPVDLKLGTLTLGQGGATSTGFGNIGAGVINFDTGTLDATTINLAVVASLSNCNATATLTVGAGGTLLIGAGGLSLANCLNGAPTTPVGTLSVNGGKVICSNSVTKANTSGTGTLTLNTGSLTMVGGVIGTPAVPIDTLDLVGATLTLAVTPNTTNAVVNTLNAFSSTIHISSLPTILSYPAQFTLMKYGSGYSDSTLGSLPAGYAGSLVNNASTVDLVLTSGPGPGFQQLTWNGNLSGDWDTSSANWQGAKTYAQKDYVLFDDTATGTTTVNLTASLTPGLLTVSNFTKNYTFGGTGDIAGAIALTKAGTGMLTIANTGINTFSNGVSILDGTVKLSGGADRLPTDCIVTLADVPGALLDLNNLNQTLRSLNGGGYNGGNIALGSATLTDWSGGTYGGVLSGSGQLIKTNWPGGPTGVLTLTNANTYTGGTIIGGYTNATTLAVGNQTGSGTGSGLVQVLTNGILSLGAGAAGGSVAAGTITNSGTVRLNRGDDLVFTNIVVGPGGLQKQNTNVVAILGANACQGYTALDLGTLRVANAGAVGSGTVVVGNGAATLQLTNGITLTNALYLGSKPGATGPVPCVENISGDNTLTGPMSLTANGSIGWLFSATSGRLLISGTMSRLDPSQTSQNTTRTFWLRGDATGEWSGSIIDPVGGTTNLALRKDGLGTWTLSGANTYTGPTVVSNGTLLVSGSIAGSSSVTVQGGTLAGTGTIAGPVSVNALGTLAPGSSAGALTINNNLTLAGTTVMEVSHAATDRVTGLGLVSLGGTLQVVVQGTLSGNEVFKLFSATTYTNDFATYDLPVLPTPYAWDYSKMTVDGTLRVTGGGDLPPPKLAVAQTGNQLAFSWNDVSFKLQAQTNSLQVGLGGSWGDYPGGNASPVNVTVNPANPTVFFRLISQ